jgi:hypothetical protein
MTVPALSLSLSLSPLRLHLVYCGANEHPLPFPSPVCTWFTGCKLRCSLPRLYLVYWVQTSLLSPSFGLYVRLLPLAVRCLGICCSYVFTMSVWTFILSPVFLRLPVFVPCPSCFPVYALFVCAWFTAAHNVAYIVTVSVRTFLILSPVSFARRS